MQAAIISQMARIHYIGFLNLVLICWRSLGQIYRENLLEIIYNVMDIIPPNPDGSLPEVPAWLIVLATVAVIVLYLLTVIFG